MHTNSGDATENSGAHSCRRTCMLLNLAVEGLLASTSISTPSPRAQSWPGSATCISACPMLKQQHDVMATSCSAGQEEEHLYCCQAGWAFVHALGLEGSMQEVRAAAQRRPARPQKLAPLAHLSLQDGRGRARPGRRAHRKDQLAGEVPMEGPRPVADGPHRVLYGAPAEAQQCSVTATS